MEAVLTTNDLIELSYAQALLKDAGIESEVGVGSITKAFGVVPHHLYVEDDRFVQACEILRQGLNEAQQETR